MKPWRKPLVALALILISALLVVPLPLSSLAAPQVPAGTPSFLPVVLKNFPQTPTPTATKTPTPTATPITSPIPLTVGPVIGSEMIIFLPLTPPIHVGDAIHWVLGSPCPTVPTGP